MNIGRIKPDLQEVFETRLFPPRNLKEAFNALRPSSCSSKVCFPAKNSFQTLGFLRGCLRIAVTSQVHLDEEKDIFVYRMRATAWLHAEEGNIFVSSC